MRTIHTPVLVVGAGPAGLVTSLTLAHHGVPSLLVEKHAGTSIYPRATGISVRTMEIFRGLGVEAAVRARSLDVKPLMHVSPTLAAPTERVVPLGFPTAEEAAAVSPTSAVISPQDHVEPVLVDRLRELGLADLRFSTELVSFEQDPDAVHAVIRDVTSGEETRVVASYLVGADGGRSRVRSILAIEPVGPTGLEQHASFLFRAPGLLASLGERRFGLYMVGGPGMPSGVVLPMDADDRWVYAAFGPPPMLEHLLADEAAAVATIGAVIGVVDQPVELLASMPLEFAAQLAPTWRVGRTFLAGDAAHRMPPIGGRGMNTAIADAANLGWKLAWAASGFAGDALLDTYEAERLPVARRNLSMSLVRYPEQAAAAGFTVDVPDGVPPEGTPDGLLEDLGYRYSSAAGWPAGDEPGATTPAGLVGSRAPHAWVRSGGRTVSTIDVAAGELRLITAGDPCGWRRAAGALSAGRLVLRGLATLVNAMGPDPLPPIIVVSIGHELEDPDGTAAAAYGLEPGGAVLVRPDGHVAARWARRPDDRRAALAQALAAVTGYPASASTPARSASNTGAKARTPSGELGRSWTWTWSQPRSK
jgi:2-polyprenyl-6-methoxyphenol hydroxylase-like FAD-dependent oxidoreductase